MFVDLQFGAVDMFGDPRFGAFDEFSDASITNFLEVAEIKQQNQHMGNFPNVTGSL